MLRTNAHGRTVWVKDLVVEKRQGAQGEYESKSILFNFATNRNYQVSQTQADGSIKKVYPTDFILCRANGAVAQLISDYCSAKNAEGKTISRHLNIYGHIETFKSKRKFDIQVPINGVTYPVSFESEVDSHIFIVEEIEFLDSNPTKAPATVQGGSVQVGSPVQGQNANPIANAMNAPVQPQVQVQPQTVPTQPQVQVTPQATPATPVQATPQAQQAQATSPAQYAPVTPEGYTGAEAPF